MVGWFSWASKQMEEKSGGGSKMERQRHGLWVVISLLHFDYSPGRALFDASLVVFLSLRNMMEAPLQRANQLEQQCCQLLQD